MFVIEWKWPNEYNMISRAASELHPFGDTNTSVMDRIRLDAQAQKHVAAYLEYRDIVGDADGGKLMSEAEYEAFKQRVSKSRAMKNRIFVTWRNLDTGVDCKNIGPASTCFCGHKYRDHHCSHDLEKVDDVSQLKFPCKVPKCKCSCFTYIPIHGANSFKCFCKHESKLHDPNEPFTCTKCATRPKLPSAKNFKAARPGGSSTARYCDGFCSAFSCGCGERWDMHKTLFETREQRIAAGRTVESLWTGDGNMAQGQGAITNFSSLMHGAIRQEPYQYSAIEQENLQMLTEAGGKLSREQELQLMEKAFKQRSSSGPSMSKPTRSMAPSSSSTVSATREDRVVDVTNTDEAPADIPRGSLALLKKKHGAKTRGSLGQLPVEPKPTSEVCDEPTLQKLQELEAEMRSATISEARRYAVKKQMAMLRAKQLRAERKLQSGEQH